MNYNLIKKEEIRKQGNEETRKQGNKETINKICIIGLIPYLFISLYCKSLISLTIFINGFIFHYRFFNYNIMYYIDCLFNCFFATYCIISSKFDFYIISSIIVSLIIFIYTNYINIYFKEKYILNNVFHVIFVQGFSALGLTRYYIYL